MAENLGCPNRRRVGRRHGPRSCLACRPVPVEAVSLAEEALVAIHDQFAPDLLVCDMVLPGMSGVELERVETMLAQPPQ